MEQLVSFVMDNLYFVILIVGIIYSLFSRKKSRERSQNRMPDFGGPGRQGPRQRPKPTGSQPVTVKPRTPSPEPSQQPVRLEVQERGRMSIRASSAAERASEGGELARASRRAPANVVPQLPQPNKPGAGGSPLSRDDLSRAVMWAEILGPPRSKRPHGR